MVLKQLYNHCRPWATLQELSKLWWLLLSPACGTFTVKYYHRNYRNGGFCQNRGTSSACCWHEVPPQELFTSSPASPSSSIMAPQPKPTTVFQSKPIGLIQRKVWREKKPPLPELEYPPISELLTKPHHSLSWKTHQFLSSPSQGLKSSPHQSSL